MTISQHEGDFWAEPVIDVSLGDLIHGVALEPAMPQEPIMILVANFPVDLIAIVEEIQEDEAL